jgi:hypothetical protein
MSNNSNATGGLSLSSVLTVVFVVLKLTDNIDWSWWWVLSPLWIGFVLVFVIVVIAGLVAAVKR